MRLRHLLAGLGLVAGGAALLWPRPAAAAPAGLTVNEDRLRVARERLAAFVAAARISAAVGTAWRGSEGLYLVVTPGKAFVAEDAAALPRRVDGLDVVIVGWPR